MEEATIEIWKDIPGYESKYRVSNLGRVKSLGWNYIRSNNRRSIREDKILKAHITRFGYERLELNKENKGIKFHVHRLVAIAFIPNPENKPEVNHINGDKRNNSVSNLEWNSSLENIVHANVSGLAKPSQGESHVRAKLTAEQVNEIRSLFASGEYKNKTKVALNYGVSRKAITDIVHNKNWKSLLPSQ